MASIGFKEWQIVCDALASGRQALILRKGGIHEGREGFSFAHPSFFLFPTRFHAQAEQVREGIFTTKPEWQSGDTISITHHAQVLRAVTLTDWEKVSSLLPFHIYSEQTIRERFDWQGKGMATGSIHIAHVRVAALRRPWEFPYLKSHGGCRSWVDLPEPPLGCLEDSEPIVDQAAVTRVVELLNG